MELSEEKLLDGICRGDLTSYEDLYKRYYVYLCLVAEHIVRNHSDAEEIVSDVFIRLWNSRSNVSITTSFKSYLVKAVYNTSLNYLERNKKSNKLTESLSESDHKLLAWSSDYPLGQLYRKEVMDILEQGVCKLPDSCREIFKLSREKEMDYNKIADKLGISKNTVKTQIKIALVRLRKELKDYLGIFLALMLI
jgi:RNA polymerase sigma-70 factor (ECF subfamily)